MKRYLLPALLFCVPISASAQPASLTPNELFWFTQGTRPEAVDRQRLGELLTLDPQKAADQRWLVELLAVGWPDFSDADMKTVVGMKKLTHLWIRKPNDNERRGDFKLTAAGWRELQNLKNLRVLGISDCELDDDSFAEIGKLTALDTIFLDCKGPEGCVKKLMNLKKLVHVSINVPGSKPGDDIAADLAKMTELKDLSVGYATISDDGVKALAKLPSLRSLALNSPNITDAGFLAVAKMKRMTAVSLASDKITQDGIDEAWKAKPDMLMVNGAGKPPGPDSLWTMQIDFFGPYGGMFGPANNKELANLIDRMPRLRRLSIGWPGMKGAVMKDVTQFKGLTHLYVTQDLLDGPENLKVKFETKDWKRVSELPKLHMLAVNGMTLDADVCAVIGKLRELRTLRLIRCKGDVSVRHFADLKKLTGLELSGAQLTDAGLKQLGSFENLHYLSLAENRLTDDGLKHLASFPKLGFVNLDGNKITDAGLKHLTRMNRLWNVSLAGTAITDEGLKVLAEIKSLNAVTLPMDRITQPGLQWFAKARPDVEYLPPQPIGRRISQSE